MHGLAGLVLLFLLLLVCVCKQREGEFVYKLAESVCIVTVCHICGIL